jgi:hypothetical protein
MFSLLKIENDSKLFLIDIRNFSMVSIQSDQKENKSEQALQIIGHVVAESYANKRSMHGRRTICDLKCYFIINHTS